MKRRRRAAPVSEKGWSYPTSNIDGMPERILKSFKAGQVIPPGATYLTFAIKKDTPHFFFLLPHAVKEKPKNQLGFKLN